MTPLFNARGLEDRTLSTLDTLTALAYNHVGTAVSNALFIQLQVKS
jgi:hypothetical protein